MAEHRLPKELADDAKMFARIGGVPAPQLGKFEAVINHISGPDFGKEKKRQAPAK